ncbi:hypothetical protein F5X96DRAFT_375837 [Biscogniauxia mediterranea]|nr:hypothetical protein F5X96DRAFT_375837 [Biscogniauxia mediterranea]
MSFDDTIGFSDYRHLGRVASMSGFVFLIYIYIIELAGWTLQTSRLAASLRPSPFHFTTCHIFTGPCLHVDVPSNRSGLFICKVHFIPWCTIFSSSSVCSNMIPTYDYTLESLLCALYKQPRITMYWDSQGAEGALSLVIGSGIGLRLAVWALARYRQ